MDARRQPLEFEKVKKNGTGADNFLTVQHSCKCDELKYKEESPANAKGTRDSSACMKAHCEQM